MLLFDFFTFILCLIPTLLCVYSIFKVGIKPLTIIQIVFFIIFVFPIFLDIIFSKPEYRSFYGFYIYAEDNRVAFIYNLFIVSVSYFNYFFRGKKIVNLNISNSLIKIDIFLILIALLPLFFIFFAPDIDLYKLYGGASIRDFDEFSNTFHGFLNIFTFVSAFICSYLIIKNFNKRFFLTFLLFLIVIADFWLNGKRTIVLIFLFFLGLFYFIVNKNLKSFLFLLILLLTYSFYNSWYQSNIRDFDDSKSFNEKYENIRVDYFRDQRVKMAIYGELKPYKIKILPYRGESFIFSSTFFIPRSIWPNKPYPYAQYFTSAMFNSEPKLWGWGMTTSIYDEFIANLGLIGLLLIQILLLYYIKIIGNLNSPKFQIYSVFLFVLLMMVQMIAFMFLYIFWFIWLVKLKFYKR